MRSSIGVGAGCNGGHLRHPTLLVPADRSHDDPRRRGHRDAGGLAGIPVRIRGASGRVRRALAVAGSGSDPQAAHDRRCRAARAVVSALDTPMAESDLVAIRIAQAAASGVAATPRRSVRKQRRARGGQVAARREPARHAGVVLPRGRSRLDVSASRTPLVAVRRTADVSGFEHDDGRGAVGCGAWSLSSDVGQGSRQ